MKPETKMIETAIPFPGFYESWYDHAMDREIESDAEHFAQEWGIDVSKVAEALWRHADWSDARDKVARLHCEKWLAAFEDETGIEIEAHEFAAMQSPREYNFATDRVFVAIPFKVIYKAFDQCKGNDGFVTLQKVIKERFTSYDGFMSFYSNDLDEWLEKQLEQWDHNEVETLLIATLALHTDVKDFQQAVEDSVLDYGSGNGYFAASYDLETVKAAALEEAKVNQ